ncbi:TadE/TadG family type IV pilus assembly protein [Angustibacter luteus]|uniref:TadE/TadG family type IV pilus assembly protein n=1 Tax=Angustibacter luteus TaxID=658456 RepID=A0ABW1JJ11_9ACTN
MSHPERRGHGDRGSAAVDFALVGALLSLLFAALLQLVLVLHVRNTAIDCAAEGARLGARADRVPADGLARARELLASELPGRVGPRPDDAGVALVQVSGVQAVEVTLTVPLPVLGVLGYAGSTTVRGHAFVEAQPFGGTG